MHFINWCQKLKNMMEEPARNILTLVMDRSEKFLIFGHFLQKC